MTRNVRLAVLAWVALASLSAPAMAQVLYGSLVGTVTDESGLAVPGASVTITQLETNQSRAGTTSSNGTYTFPNIAAGTYQVDVALTGFQPFRARDIVVRQNVAVRVDAKLAVGNLQESVEVSAAAAILQTETAAVQSQTTSLQIETLPTSGRSFHSLMVLTPGVGQPDYFQQGGTNNPSRAMTVSVNGQPTSNTVVRIDGVSATNQWIEGLQSYSPSMEAIETVNVVTNSFDADLGMAGGASVNVQVKSGTECVKGLDVRVPGQMRGPGREATSRPLAAIKVPIKSTFLVARSVDRSFGTSSFTSSASKARSRERRARNSG